MAQDGRPWTPANCRENSSDARNATTPARPEDRRTLRTEHREYRDSVNTNARGERHRFPATIRKNGLPRPPVTRALQNAGGHAPHLGIRSCCQANGIAWPTAFAQPWNPARQKDKELLNSQGFLVDAAAEWITLFVPLPRGLRGSRGVLLLAHGRARFFQFADRIGFCRVPETEGR